MAGDPSAIVTHGTAGIAMLLDGTTAQGMTHSQYLELLESVGCPRLSSLAPC